METTLPGNARVHCNCQLIRHLAVAARTGIALLARARFLVHFVVVEVFVIVPILPLY